MASNAEIGVGSASRTAANEDVRLELAFPFLECANRAAIANRDFLAFGDVLHSMHRFPFDAGIPRVVGIGYAGMVDPRCV